MVLGKYVNEELREFHIACSSDFNDIDIKDLNFFLVLLTFELKQKDLDKEIELGTGLDLLDQAILLGVQL